jgi:hypothetical protein
MNLSTREGSWRLRWGAIFAGAVLAIATSWTGELLGGLLSLIQPGESSAWGWIGGIVALAMVMAGAFAGAWVAARTAAASDRTQGMLHGLVVWGVFGTASAALFAVLGGNLALVAGATAGAVRLAIGFAMLGLMGALLASVAGGALAAGAQPQDWTRRRRRASEPASATIRTPAPQQPVTTYPRPVEPGDVPPSVH